MSFASRHILGLRSMSGDDINLILDTAVSMKEIHTRTIKKVPALRGKLVALLFFEPSTRTRMSFELAAKRLSADTTSIASSTSSVVKGETLLDTVKNIRAMGADLFVIRHTSSGAPHMVADNIDVPVLNAGDGINEHPTQALLDIFTLRETFGRVSGLKVTYVGDLLHSRVARSGMWGLLKLGAEVRFAGPPTLMPPGIERLGVKVYHDLEPAVRDCDAINVLRIQRERMTANFFPSLHEFHHQYGVGRRLMTRLGINPLVMHPGPMNRGVEITGEIADGDQSAILRQVTNGVAIRMAVLYLLTVGRGVLPTERITAETTE